MARFKYRGRNPVGAAVEGLLEAASADAVAAQLHAAGVTPIAIETASEAGGFSWSLPVLPPKPPNRQELTLFCRQLYTLIKSGVPIIRGLSQLADTTREPLAGTIREVIDDLEAGRDLAGALARHPRTFNPLFLSMVRVGEVSGRLEQAMLQLNVYLDREIQTTNAIKTALRYPTTVMIALVVAVFIIMTAVIPKFASFYGKNGLELPLATKIIMGVSNFFVDYWYLMALFAISGVAAMVRYVNTERGRLWWDRNKLRLPRIGTLILRATLARFARAFGMSMDAGVPILQALAVTARAVDNEYIGGKVINMRDSIERGESLSRTALRVNVFTPLTVQMLTVGEETGQLPDMLDEVAAFYEREVDYD
ncbi:MAG: type II secretion system F family protein, partial [Gammaproteobacteria bacterium]|nr:type II secretion system F family protein [Gammaproteobacteria bacterium]